MYAAIATSPTATTVTLRTWTNTRSYSAPSPAAASSANRFSFGPKNMPPRAPRAIAITNGTVTHASDHVPHRPAHLAHRAAVAQRVMDERQQVVFFPGRVAQPGQPPLDQLVVAVGLEGLEPFDLIALGLRIDAQRLGHLDVVGDVLVDADHDVLADP